MPAPEVITSSAEPNFNPKRIAWLYDSINKAAQTQLLDLPTSPEGEIIVNVDEVNRLLDALVVFAYRKKAGTNQARRLDAYLRGQSLRQIAESEGASLFTARGFQQRVGRVLAEILTENPEALTTTESNASTPECPRFLQPLLGELSARQVLIMSTRFGDEGELLTSLPGAAEELGMTTDQIYTTEKYIWKKFPEYKPDRAPGRVNYTVKFPIGDMVLHLTKRRAEIMGHLYNADGTQNMSIPEVAELLDLPETWILNVQRQALGELADAADDIVPFPIGNMTLELSPRNAEIIGHLYNSDGTQRMSPREAARALGISVARISEVRSQVLGGMRSKSVPDQQGEPLVRTQQVPGERESLSVESSEHLESFLRSDHPLPTPEQAAVLESIRLRYVERRDNPSGEDADEQMLWPNEDQRIFLQVLGNSPRKILPQSPAALVNKYRQRLEQDPRYQHLDDQQKSTTAETYRQRIDYAFSVYMNWALSPHEQKTL